MTESTSYVDIASWFGNYKLITGLSNILIPFCVSCRRVRAILTVAATRGGHSAPVENALGKIIIFVILGPF